MATNVQHRWSNDQLIAGIETPAWIDLLTRQGHRVDLGYLHRAVFVGALSLPATVLGRIEDARYARQLARTEIQDPVFVLGHWRSGTTFLHNLLGRLPNHTYPTVFQAVFPTCFLTAGTFVPQLTSRFLDDTRGYDAVKHGWDEAAEDEIALAKLTGLSPYVAFMFPDRAAQYEKYVDFMECTSDERERFKDALAYLLKKISVATDGERVVVKSCAHTARVRLLLEQFPRARFVMVHRDPYTVFASTLHMRSRTDWENLFHLPEQDLEQLRIEQTLSLGQRIFERIVEDRELIPEGQYCEIRYSDLVKDPMGHIRRVYDEVNLPDFDQAEPHLQRYLDSVSGYRTNKLRTLDARTREKVETRWAVAFEAFGYPETPDTESPHE